MKVKRLVGFIGILVLLLLVSYEFIVCAKEQHLSEGILGEDYASMPYRNDQQGQLVMDEKAAAVCEEEIFSYFKSARGGYMMCRCQQR